MRPGSPACYTCKSSGDRGMHRWERTNQGARCTYCGLDLTGEDAADVFRGTPLPISRKQEQDDFTAAVIAARNVG